MKNSNFNNSKIGGIKKYKVIVADDESHICCAIGGQSDKTTISNCWQHWQTAERSSI